MSTFDVDSITSISDIAMQTDDPDLVRACAKVVACQADGFQAYIFARDIPGTDIAEMQDAVMRSREVMWISAFIRDVPGADVPELIRWLIHLDEDEPNSGLTTILVEALQRHTVDQELFNRCQEIILVAGDARLALYASTIPGIDVRACGDIIYACDKGVYFKLFANKHPDVAMDITG